MPYATMRQLLESGVHFGHQTRRWHPKMSEYIFGARNGIHIVNLQKTIELLRKAYDFIVSTVSDGGSVLFVGTKKQAADICSEYSKSCGMYYVNHRWLGGMLTNFVTIKKSVDRYKLLEKMKNDGSITYLPKKEMIKTLRELSKLERSLAGIKDMQNIPEIIYIVDVKKEKIAINEARRLNIASIAVVDTNCDPEYITYPIPGNDDALKSIRLITSNISDAVNEGLILREQRKLAAVEEKEKV